MPYSPSGSSPWWGNNPPTSLYGPGRDEQGRVIPFTERGRPSPVAPAPGTIGPTPVTSTPTLPDYSGINQIIQQINAQNQQAQTAALNNRIPMAPQLQQQSSQNIAALLNPPTVFGEMDVPSAAAAVASGTVGSPFAGHYGIKLTDNERIRRMGLGEQFLSGALARNPAAPIADPQSLVQMLSQQMYGAGQNQMERDLRERIANAQMANQALQNRRNINAYNQRSNSYGPSLPTDYGSPGMGAGVVGGAQTNIPALPASPSPGFGYGAGVPNLGGLDNWAALTAAQQAQYNAALGQNPYFGLPDWQNPYSGDDPMPAYDPPAPMIEDYY